MKKKLTKSSRNVVLTGALVGMGEHIGTDPIVIRVLYVSLSSVAFGSPAILCILLALIIPSTHSTRTSYGHDNAHYGRNNHREQVREQAKKRKEVEKVDDDEWSDF